MARATQAMGIAGRPNLPNPQPHVSVYIRTGPITRNFCTMSQNCQKHGWLAQQETTTAPDVEVAAPVSEVIVDVPVEFGAHVGLAATLVRLDPTLAQAEAANVEAGIAGARTRVAVTKHELERAQNLYRKKVASEQDLERAELAADEATVRFQEAEARMAVARKRLQDTTLVAPVPCVGPAPVRSGRARAGRRGGGRDPSRRCTVCADLGPRARGRAPGPRCCSRRAHRWHRPAAARPYSRHQPRTRVHVALRAHGTRARAPRVRGPCRHRRRARLVAAGASASAPTWPSWTKVVSC